MPKKRLKLGTPTKGPKVGATDAAKKAEMAKKSATQRKKQIKTKTAPVRKKQVQKKTKPSAKKKMPGKRRMFTESFIR